MEGCCSDARTMKFSIGTYFFLNYLFLSTYSCLTLVIPVSSKHQHLDVDMETSATTYFNQGATLTFDF